MGIDVELSLEDKARLELQENAINLARDKGMKVGLVRPITLWPFPDKAMMKVAKSAKKLLVVEMSNGQFIDDVKLAIECSRPVEFLGVGGGWYPSVEGILEKLEKVYK